MMSLRLFNKEQLYENHTQVALEKEWAKYKYWVMSRSQKAYNDLRALFKNNDTVSLDDFYKIIDEVSDTEEDPKAEHNAFEHVWGYFKNIATDDEKEVFLNVLNEYRKASISRSNVYEILYAYAQKYQVKYLLDSYYFEDYEKDA